MSHSLTGLSGSALLACRWTTLVGAAGAHGAASPTRERELAAGPSVVVGS
ncbi:hypothetical protein AB0G82_17200 [Streptomyces anulatus]